MNKLIEAGYERGVLRPVQPLELREGEPVKIVVISEQASQQPAARPWDANAARAAMKEIAALPLEGPTDSASVGREHDRYLYGDLSPFERELPR
jgi:predicted DNA-binding antitoxin AbrB/MazE fold protein